MEDFSITIGSTRLTSLSRIVDAVLDQYEASIGACLNELRVEDRRRAVEFLYSIGYFDMRDSVESFCSRAHVSRITVYEHLKRAINHPVR